MNDLIPTHRAAKAFNRKYLWPTPLGIACWLGAVGTAKIWGLRVFLNTHFFFEMGIMVALLTSVIYAVRLAGKGRSLAPRWVFYLNLLFGPLVFTVQIVADLVSSLSGS
ncbi:hypothetical protein JIN85_18085 [Luteolibacter pohnpeiensis]|uniref:Uncharacterized protein n=1 Tax=Luteolibacter pohnpeiensis TaxID=454153 RepID=A0A934VXY3_9BACT|nr:hypothetical protein [Luteolibacter pohnpeiensis]MBK1884333.1 hypothetical protein [Luteolibacter pohnpeiensis]